MLAVEIQGEKVEITGHALSRWRDRVYPGDTVAAAATRLADKIKDSGRIKRKRPSWTYKTGDLKHKFLTEGYLVVNQPRNPGRAKLEVAFPLTLKGELLIATTALVQGYDRRRQDGR